MTPNLHFFSFFFQTTTIAHGRCTNDFEGTSAATPLAAGVVALMLEAKYAQLLNLTHFQASTVLWVCLLFFLFFGLCSVASILNTN